MVPRGRKRLRLACQQYVSVITWPFVIIHFMNGPAKVVPKNQPKEMSNNERKSGNNKQRPQTARHGLGSSASKEIRAGEHSAQGGRKEEVKVRQVVARCGTRQIAHLIKSEPVIPGTIPGRARVDDEVTSPSLLLSARCEPGNFLSGIRSPVAEIGSNPLNCKNPTNGRSCVRTQI